MIQVQETNIQKILANVSFERGFHFCKENGSYTGITATSLSEFALKLEGIDEESILFHYPRGDFQKWVQQIIGDEEFANRMCFNRKNLDGESLRKQLTKMVQKRITELQKNS
jgi:hypothetical protein